MITYYQQGDVLLKKIAELPSGLTKLDTKVLQLGETTGHKHQFFESHVEVYIDPLSVSTETRITPDEGKYLVVGNVAYLRHEEHAPIGIEPGIYQVDIVREYDYEKHEISRVID